MKHLILVTGLIIVVLIIISCWIFYKYKSEPASPIIENIVNHETHSKHLYEEMQKSLDDCVKNSDTNRLRLLSVQLDNQLKLEDFLIRFREAENAKFTLFGNIIIPALISLLISIITFFTAKYKTK